MTIQEQANAILHWFQQYQPDPKPELNYENPFQLLVAVVLSAQCTDKRVNQITPALFKRYPSPREMSLSSQDEIFPFVKSCSYPNNKSKHLLLLSKILMETFKGEVPSTVEELETLPGVGHKTANVLVSVIHNAPALAVDTHVFRVAARLGLTKNAKTPLETEKQLLKLIPTEKVARAHHWFILHGRYVCTAKKPNCKECGISGFCAFFDYGKPAINKTI